jgi:sugar phosphate permease
LATPLTGAAADADAEAALYRRVGLSLLGVLLPCYIVAMIDRLNVGYAKLQFMADLHFTEQMFGIAAGSLYVGYILFEVPSNLMLRRVGVRLTLLRIMGLWGIFTMALAWAGDRWSFYALRFLVGAAEAGFFPGMVYYLTLWFPDRYRARTVSLLALAVPVSGLIGGRLSTWIMTRLDGAGGLHGWQWLFLLEGAPALLMGLVAYRLLPDGPAGARFLSAADKARIARDLDADPMPARSPATFAQTLRRRRTYLLALVYFAFYSAQSVLLVWVPTLLRNAGMRDLLDIGWRSSAISLAGALGMALIGWSSDRSGERRIHLLACGVVASGAFLLLPAAARSPDATSALLALAAATMFGFLALFWTLPTLEMGKEARAGGIALVSAIGASGSALSPVFIGHVKDLTGSPFGAIDALALLFLASMAALYAYAPARRTAAQPPDGRLAR